MFPVILDDKASAQVKRLLAKDGRPGAFLRVGVKGGGCSGLEYVLRIDAQPLENDLVAEFDGAKIVCDIRSAKFLNGARLIHTGNLIGGGFKFENPNADHSCGCGSSFTPKSA
jgi:iron-sulfur cluster assembly protein